MQAAVARRFGQPLTMEEVPVPDPGPGEALVRIVASGVCHTDLHAADGDWPVKPKLPFIPGHEGVGRAAKLGKGAVTPMPVGYEGHRPKSDNIAGQRRRCHPTTGSFRMESWMFGLHLPGCVKVTCAVVASLLLPIPSSHAQSSKCVNGYRTITRDVSPNDSPGQNDIVVRCR